MNCKRENGENYPIVDKRSSVVRRDEISRLFTDVVETISRCTLDNNWRWGSTIHRRLITTSSVLSERTRAFTRRNRVRRRLIITTRAIRKEYETSVRCIILLAVGGRFLLLYGSLRLLLLLFHRRILLIRRLMMNELGMMMLITVSRRGRRARWGRVGGRWGRCRRGENDHGRRWDGRESGGGGLFRRLV